MVSASGSASNGEKVTNMDTRTNVADPESGVLRRHGKRGSVLSYLGAKGRTTGRVDAEVPVVSVAPGTALLLRPDLEKKSSSNLFSLSSVPGTIVTEKPLKDKITLLRYAVSRGDDNQASKLMKELKDAGLLESAGFTTQDAAGNGLLQIAALAGYNKVLDRLLAYDFNINSVDRNHGTALQAAIYMGSSASIELLLGRAKTNTLGPNNDMSNTKGLNVNTKGGYYGCALQVAAYRANADLVRRLVDKHEADVNISGGKYGFPLQAAVRTGKMDVVKPILSKSTVKVNAKGGMYGTVLQAVAKGPYRSRQQLRELSRGHVLRQDAQDSNGKPISLHDNATEQEYLEVANELFKKGAKMDGGSGKFGNPINAAACSGWEVMLSLMLGKFDARLSEWTEAKQVVLKKSLLTAITQSPENNLPLVKLLVEPDASIIKYEMSESMPNLPLEAAATNNLPEVVEYLLQKGADECAESGIHGTALRAAIATDLGHEGIAKILIEHQASKYGVEKHSKSRLTKAQTNITAASKTKQEVDVAVSEKPRTMSDSMIGHATEVDEDLQAKRKLIEKGAEWICRDADYGNILQLATSRGLASTTELLLDYGADPNVQDTSQRRALHIASWFGFPAIVDLLLDHGADINATDEWGATALDQTEESLDRDGHPGGTEAGLQSIKQTLADKLGEINHEKPGTEFKGPKRVKTIPKQPTEERHPGSSESVSSAASLATNSTALRKAKPVFTMPSWIPGLGYHATVVDIWESGDQECLLLKQPRVDEILYHKAVLDAVMKYEGKPKEAKDKVRWIHLPTNNMTWAEMLVTSVCNQKRMPAYKSLWGNDPFYSSADLSPHARFITPQCGRLIRDGPKSKEENATTPLFMAMPYLHWEADRAQFNVAKLIDKVKEESQKTSGARRNKMWPSEKHGSPSSPSAIRQGPPDARRSIITETNEVALEVPEAEEDYEELLRRYLFKRRPVHLRRTLDQYYYSHLADTHFRDGDQVVMRQLNENTKRLKLDDDPKYKKLLEIKKREEDFEKAGFVSRMLKKISTSRPKKLKEVTSQILAIEQKPYRDGNSPVLMVDQLWLWIIDEKTIISCFPHRQYDRDKEDLDAADKTDILKTIVTYLHSPRRPEIDTSHALAELIFSQCVGVLHRADMIPEVDFLKNYSVQSNIWADEVMQMLSRFVEEFEKFMFWIKQQPAESEESIRWFEEIFSVTKQTHLLRNIQDIKDELNMLQDVFEDQVKVLLAAGEEIEQSNLQYCHKCVVGLAGQQNEICSHGSKAFVDQSLKHLKHVERMQTQASQAYDTLKDLLDLKQQQAGVLEARVSRRQAIASGEQSKTILVFTVVTIVFLPLTFVTTIFALPIAEFARVVVPHGDMPPTPFLSKSFVEPYIIGVTFGVAVPLLIAAFTIQDIQNGCKMAMNKFQMKRNARKEEKRKARGEDDDVPDFLK